MFPTQDSATAPGAMLVDLPPDPAEEVAMSTKGRVSNPVWSTFYAFLALSSGLVLSPVLKLFYQEGYGDVKNTLSVLDMCAAITILVLMLLLRNCCATSTPVVEQDEAWSRSRGNGELLLSTQAHRSRRPFSWNFQCCRVLLQTTFLPGTCIFFATVSAALANYESLFLFWAFAPLEIVFVMVLARYLQTATDQRVELQFSGRQKKSRSRRRFFGRVGGYSVDMSQAVGAQEDEKFCRCRRQVGVGRHEFAGTAGRIPRRNRIEHCIPVEPSALYCLHTQSLRENGRHICPAPILVQGNMGLHVLCDLCRLDRRLALVCPGY